MFSYSEPLKHFLLSAVTSFCTTVHWKEVKGRFNLHVVPLGCGASGSNDFQNFLLQCEGAGNTDTPNSDFQGDVT